MEKTEIKNQIVELLNTASEYIDISDENSDMFSSKCGVMPRDLLFVCMELKKKYPIDYNKVVDLVDEYSLNKFTDAIFAQL